MPRIPLSPPDPPQPDALFDASDLPRLVGPPPGSIAEAFETFHEANPWVYDRLRVLALDLVRSGKTRVGIGMLWEVLRWQYARATTTDDGLRLNNNHRSRYARMLADREPELAEAFETRRLRSA